MLKSPQTVVDYLTVLNWSYMDEVTTTEHNQSLHMESWEEVGLLSHCMSEKKNPTILLWSFSAGDGSALDLRLF